MLDERNAFKIIDLARQLKGRAYTQNTRGILAREAERQQAARRAHGREAAPSRLGCAGGVAVRTERFECAGIYGPGFSWLSPFPLTGGYVSNSKTALIGLLPV